MDKEACNAELKQLCWGIYLGSASSALPKRICGWVLTAGVNECSLRVISAARCVLLLGGCMSAYLSSRTAQDVILACSWVCVVQDSHALRCKQPLADVLLLWLWIA